MRHCELVNVFPSDFHAFDLMLGGGAFAESEERRSCRRRTMSRSDTPGEKSFNVAKIGEDTFHSSSDQCDNVGHPIAIIDWNVLEHITPFMFGPLLDFFNHLSRRATARGGRVVEPNVMTSEVETPVESTFLPFLVD